MTKNTSICNHSEKSKVCMKKNLRQTFALFATDARGLPVNGLCYQTLQRKEKFNLLNYWT